MTITGRFPGDAPYFGVRLRCGSFQGRVWMLADTGATRTTLLDGDVRSLAMPAALLSATVTQIVGVGGSVRSFQMRNVEIALASDQGDWIVHQDIYVVQHDLQQLSSTEAARILRLPSLLGRE